MVVAGTVIVLRDNTSTHLADLFTKTMEAPKIKGLLKNIYILEEKLEYVAFIP